MRTVTYGGAVSLDGFLAGADGSIDWLYFSPDVQQVMADYWKDVDTILMGRKTYMVAAASQGGGARAKSKSPSKSASSSPAKSTRAQAASTSRSPSKSTSPSKPKPATSKTPAMRTYVFSRTLAGIDAPGVELVSSDAAAFVRDLKQQPGKRICLMGGGELAQSLLAANLVDEIGLNIHPILLGAGIPVFRDPGQRVTLTLTECRSMAGGCVLAKYALAAAPA